VREERNQVLPIKNILKKKEWKTIEGDRVEDNNVAYSKPSDYLLPHVLDPFKNWREQEVFEWEGSRTLKVGAISCYLYNLFKMTS
jgi:hypothetical protein